MSIYLDPMGHLFSDKSIDELYDFAVNKLKMSPKWNHYSKNFPHFDITTKSVRRKAVSLGAVELPCMRTALVKIKDAEVIFKSNGPMFPWYYCKGLHGQKIIRIDFEKLFSGRVSGDHTSVKCFAGIGSRETPLEILERMKSISKSFSDLGYTLRSGGAKGADEAFGSNAIKKEIFYPNTKIESGLRQRLEDLVMRFHIAPHNLNESNIKYHLRNVQIILGENIDRPVEFVVCWTRGGEAIGGTAMGINIAKAYGIPVYNLATNEGLEGLRCFYKNLTSNGCGK